MSASSAPFAGRNGSLSLPVQGAAVACHRNIRMIGEVPSGGTSMSALSMWSSSGASLVLGSCSCAPSSTLAITGSTSWKPPFVVVNEIGGSASQSWNVFTKKNACVPLWPLLRRRVASDVVPVCGSQVQGKVVQAPADAFGSVDGEV